MREGNVMKCRWIKGLMDVGLKCWIQIELLHSVTLGLHLTGF
nr:MAG TPA: hypothetical protein [Caudoviricetes sp.]